jgi:hypothetical protein
MGPSTAKGSMVGKMPSLGHVSKSGSSKPSSKPSAGPSVESKLPSKNMETETPTTVIEEESSSEGDSGDEDPVFNADEVAPLFLGSKVKTERMNVFSTEQEDKSKDLVIHSC